MTGQASGARVPCSFPAKRRTLWYPDAKPQVSTRSCQIAMALRPRESPRAMTSGYGSQALAEGLRPGFGASSAAPLALNSTPESVVTSMAGFAGATSPTEVPDAFPGAESVITSMAGFGSFRPQPPGGRNGT